MSDLVLSLYSIDDPKKTQHLLALDGAEERLHIFKASLSEEGSFDSAIDGCNGVFHTASPVLFSTNDHLVLVLFTFFVFYSVL